MQSELFSFSETLIYRFHSLPLKSLMLLRQFHFKACSEYGNVWFLSFLNLTFR